jgi:predicted nucleotide-binding protein
VFARVLSEAATVVPWWEAPEFTEQHTTIQALLAAVKTYDFAVALFTPDDSIASRGQTGTSVRDNVIFEYGLFLGQLGPARTFAFY